MLALADGLSLVFEWQQVSSSLQDSSKNSDRPQKCYDLDCLDSSFDFLYLESLEIVPSAPTTTGITVSFM